MLRFYTFLLRFYPFLLRFYTFEFLSLKKYINPLYIYYRSRAEYMVEYRLKKAKDTEISKPDTNLDVNIRLIKVALRYNQTPNSHEWIREAVY